MLVGQNLVLIITFIPLNPQLNEIRWELAIFDEVHRLKNAKTKSTIAARELAVTFKLGLSGTLMQNAMFEPFVVLNTLYPGCLGSREDYNANYVQPIKFARRTKATDKVKKDGRIAQKDLEKKWNTLILRRTKESVLGDILPQKFEKIVYVELSEAQKQVMERAFEVG